MTGTEAVVEYLREMEREVLDWLRSDMSRPYPITHDRIRTLLASLRDVERRASIEGMRSMLPYVGADIRGRCEERIAELESE